MKILNYKERKREYRREKERTKEFLLDLRYFLKIPLDLRKTMCFNRYARLERMKMLSK